jgi:hypothetical protein
MEKCCARGAGKSGSFRPFDCAQGGAKRHVGTKGEEGREIVIRALAKLGAGRRPAALGFGSIEAGAIIAAETNALAVQGMWQWAGSRRFLPLRCVI